jgi:hypothetical protein
MITAFDPFKTFIKHLAEGKLDAFLDSHCRTEKITLPGLQISTDPNLLLHGLGQSGDMERIEQLFIPDIVYVVSNPNQYGNSYFTP